MLYIYLNKINTFIHVISDILTCLCMADGVTSVRPTFNFIKILQDTTKIYQSFSFHMNDLKNKFQNSNVVDAFIQ